MEENVVEIGGRKFRRIDEGPARQEFWIDARLREAGLNSINLEPGMDAKAASEKLVDILLERVMVSGMAFTLLGGLLMPDEVPDSAWTPEIAKENADFLGSVTSKVDKSNLKALVCSMLIGFFQAGLLSLTTSPSSSSRREEPAAAQPGSAAHTAEMMRDFGDETT